VVSGRRGGASSVLQYRKHKAATQRERALARPHSNSDYGMLTV
jgi:hypothetical protein